MNKKIGLLFSLSGTIAIVGEGQLQAALLAIDDVNSTTDLIFEPVIRDAKSDPRKAAREAYSLFNDSQIDALVGCYMSSERNSIIPVLNETDGLLLYPTLYEGEQVHPNIFYLGAVPNQQVEPLLSWAIENLSSNFVLVGSDYIYPRSTNRQVRQWVENAGGNICNETYFPLACTGFDSFFQELRSLCNLWPSLAVFSTIVGTSAVSFYKEYRKNKMPFTIISPITSEREIHCMGKEASAGHICTSAYFQTIESEMNEKFVSAFTQRFGQQPISREMAASYDAIHLLSSAYRRISGTRSGGSETQKVRATLKNISFHGIQGKVIIDPKSQHLWQWSRIGRVNPEGRIETLWESPGPVPPKIDTTRIALVMTDDVGSEQPSNLCSLVGANKKFLECIRLAEVAARTSCNVLITGDTGTGKELVARHIHAVSSRNNYPFVAINCTAIPRELIESELFGYEEGSFTGAKKGGKMGKFEMANGGTLFLDEIGDMPCDLQTHLLRAIEEKEICRIGATETKRLDVRLIASTNKDLSGELGRNAGFRKDLFFRLSVFHIDLPNLCDRIDDIPLLADHFLQRLCYKSAAKKELSPETLQALQNYTWPGNVRELSNAIERAFYLSLGSMTIRPEHLSVHIINPQPSIDDENELTSDIFGSRNLASRYGFSGGITSIKDAEKRLIRQTLLRSGFNMTRTASLLGISRTTLYRRIRKYEIKARIKQQDQCGEIS